MMPSSRASALVALLLAACTPQGQPMPDLADRTEVRKAIASLSPHEDGRAAEPGAISGEAEPGSDRRLFTTWLFRYAANNELKRDPRNFDPVPRTIGEAIAQERVLFERGKAAQAARDAEFEERRAQAEADAAARKQRDAEREARNAAEAAAERAGYEAEARAVVAQREQQIEDTAAQREKRDPGYECRMRRQEAASAAMKRPDAVETRAYQRTWDSFSCPEG